MLVPRATLLTVEWLLETALSILPSVVCSCLVDSPPCNTAVLLHSSSRLVCKATWRRVAVLKIDSADMSSLGTSHLTLAW